MGRLNAGGSRANIFALLTAFPPPFSRLRMSTSAIVQLDMVTLCASEGGRVGQRGGGGG